MRSLFGPSWCIGSADMSKTIDYFNRLKSAYKSAGLNDDLAGWNLIRDYYESAGFTNEGAQQNNPGNLMWPKKGLKYGKRGKYNKVNKTYYAQFVNLPEYVAQMMIELKKAPGSPINATSGPDFVHRMKLNNYFPISEQQYTEGMKGAAQRINLLGDFKTDVDTTYVPSQDELNDQAAGWWGKRSFIEKAGIIAGGSVITIALITRR